MHIKLTNGVPAKYTLGQFRRDNPNTSFPKQIPDEMLAGYDVYPYTVPDRPQEQAERSIRSKRDEGLQECDWVVIMHTEKGTNIPLEWGVYRQALRDITGQEGFPYSVTWPTKP